MHVVMYEKHLQKCESHLTITAPIHVSDEALLLAHLLHEETPHEQRAQVRPPEVPDRAPDEPPDDRGNSAHTIINVPHENIVNQPDEEVQQEQPVDDLLLDRRHEATREAALPDLRHDLQFDLLLDRQSDDPRVELLVHEAQHE